MKVISLIKELKFEGANYKDAFLKANKWVASNIIAKDLEVTWKITKDKNNSITYIVVLKIYAELDVKEHMIQRCKACSSFHSKFYINQQLNCNICNAKALAESSQEKLKIKIQYIKEKIQEGS